MRNAMTGYTTRASLLQRLKNSGDKLAWREFYLLYSPLLYRYARARGLSTNDAEEIRDQCLSIIADKIAAFDYDREMGGFKNWLRRIVANRVVDLIRKRRPHTAQSEELRMVAASELTPDEAWEQNWRRTHVRHCVEHIRHEVSEEVFRAFHMLVFDECSVEDVCRRLGLNRNQVYKAKSRVLARVREKMVELDPELRV